jgi:pyruvate dehydrogenase E2 component (dihydrolipoamide acetyltransferase)
MATDVTMPRLSDSMEEGTILKWLVSEGDEVKRGQELVEIETDKANMTYEADTDGALIEIVAEEGDTLPIGDVIARIGDPSEAKEGDGENGGAKAAEDESEEAEGEEGAEAEGEGAEGEEEAAEGEAAQAEAAQGDGGGEERGGEDGGDAGEAADEADRGGDGGSETATATREQPASANGDGRIKASPVAKRMARELGVELAQLEGTGPGGRIVKADVEAASKGDGKAEAPAEAAPAEAPEREEEAAPEEAEREEAEAKEEAAPKEAEREEAPPKERERAEAGAKGEVEYYELSRLQQTVTRRMAESKATAPDFALSLDVDMTLAVELRSRLKEVSDPPPSINDMVVKACAIALTEFPRVNGAYRDGKFELYSNVNVGVAVAAQDTLVVPTIFNADQKSLGQISKDARAAIQKVRDKKITPPEVSGGTFTVSNLGMYGIEHFTAIINPPQAALLTVGALTKKPVVDDNDRVVPRDEMNLTLICDHRILYGADGAEFLARVKELLEQPLALSL